MGIGVLGPLTVEGSGATISRRDRAVLQALVASHGEVVSADQLADAVWGERPPASWRKNLQGCVMRLRRLLGDEAIETLPQGYRLAVGGDDVDAGRFERLVDRAGELLVLGAADRSRYLLDEALALWRGDALTDIADWSEGRIEAERLAELRLDAEELRLDCALRSGEHAQVLTELTALVRERPLRERRWALLALAQYRSGRQADALRTLREVRRVLGRELGLDPGPELVELERAILQQDPSLAVGDALTQPSAQCPYQGLVPYDVDDSEAFFGRADDVARCLRRLGEKSAVVVVGPSGSGKSSLVRAGVVASLRRAGRRVRVITPGAHPMDALTAGHPSEVLVVDQCEEAVTLCADPAERTAFFAALAEREELVVALRADRMGAVAGYPEFARVVERGLHLLNPMTAEELRACVEGPALQAGLLLEPGLVDLLLREVEGEPGALPLLSHALRETWAHREGRTLTVEGYLATGGIRGAVARTADEVWESLGPDRQRVTRDLMLRLVVTGESGEPVRHRVPRRLLTADPEHERVMERLVAARLVTSDEDSLQIAHEALARAWPRLQDWLADDAQGQQVRHHLAAAADAWDRLDRPDSELYRGIRLAQAVDWRDQSEPDLTPAERDFLDASQEQVDAELRTARRRADSEATARQRTRRLAAGLAAVLVLALVAAGLATYFQREADTRADEAAAATVQADANRLAQLSGTVGGLDTSLLLAVEALNTADTPATRDGLFGGLLEHRRAQQVMPLEGNVSTTALADDGSRLFVGVRDHVATWEVDASGPPAKVVEISFGAWVYGASSDGLFAVENPTRDEVRISVMAADGTRVLDLRGFEKLGGYPWDAELTPNGRLLRVMAAQFVRNSPDDTDYFRGVVQTLDVASGRVVDRRVVSEPRQPQWVNGKFAADASALVSWRQLPGLPAKLVRFPGGSMTPLRPVLPEGVEAVDYWPLTNGAAQARDDGSIAVFDRRGRQVQAVQAHESPVLAVAMSRDATWAASADTDGVVHLWDVDPATGRWTVRETLTGHEGSVRGLEITPSGDRLISVADDGSLISWDTSDSAGFGAPYGSGFPGRWVSIPPETVVPGELVVTTTRPRETKASEALGPAFRDIVRATFVDPRTGAVVDEVPIGPALGAQYGASASVRPGGEQVVVSNQLHTVVVDAQTRDQVARIGLSRKGRHEATEVVWDTVWTPDGSRLLLGVEGNEERADDGGLAIVDPATWTVERRVNLGRAPGVIELSPDGDVLAAGVVNLGGPDQAPPELLVVDASTYEVEEVVSLPVSAYPIDVAFSPDGKRLASVGDDGSLTVLDTRTWTALHDPVEVHDGYGRQVDWLPDGETVVTSGSDGTVSLYDVTRDLVRVRGIPGSADGRPGQTHLFPPEGNEIVVSTEDGPGRRYPMDVDAWIDRACAVAGRDLTEAEWNRFLPNQEYRRTCTDR
jgi:DNA-binding SARP family transcriptional activator/WD40 repeat protein